MRLVSKPRIVSSIGIDIYVPVRLPMDIRPDCACRTADGWGSLQERARNPTLLQIPFI